MGTMQEIAAALGRRRRHEEGQVGVAGKVARAADAVHDAGAHDVGGVDVAVDVGLDHAVHGDQAQAADQLGVVADLLRAQHDALRGSSMFVVEVAGRWGTATAPWPRPGQLARAQHVQHAVLQHLGVGREVLERAVSRPASTALAMLPTPDCSGSRLRAGGRRFTSCCRNSMMWPAMRLRGRRRVLENGVAVGQVGLDDRNHLVGVAAQVRLADAVAGRVIGMGLRCGGSWVP
jgi:hypothetical protein